MDLFDTDQLNKELLNAEVVKHLCQLLRACQIPAIGALYEVDEDGMSVLSSYAMPQLPDLSNPFSHMFGPVSELQQRLIERNYRKLCSDHGIKTAFFGCAELMETLNAGITILLPEPGKNAAGSHGKFFLCVQTGDYHIFHAAIRPLFDRYQIIGKFNNSRLKITVAALAPDDSN